MDDGMLAFLAISAALFPISAAGYALWVGKLIADRDSQVSVTAQGPLFALQNEAAARNSFFDAVLERALPEISQLVILGAGFDTRCYRLPQPSTLRCFELDEAATQQVKRAALAEAHVDASGVTFVSADFEREDWLDNLIARGFDPQRKSLFVWEGVTMYLSREGIESTLRKIARCAPGSVLAFDHFTDTVLESSSAYMR